jgi:hypothetical protein
MTYKTYNKINNAGIYNIYFILEVKFKILKLSNRDDWKICTKKEAKRKREKNEIFPQKEKEKETLQFTQKIERASKHAWNACEEASL